ncbi:hypothetical protein [Burkholderia contaminans]|uniref:hypothetical protein n=1 Tax=Burkholderia contaminans TaxID=488447 RepID=UPI0015885D04|nr:hypothetical protein [Burkholderia contaminans]
MRLALTQITKTAGSSWLPAFFQSFQYQWFGGAQFLNQIAGIVVGSRFDTTFCRGNKPIVAQYGRILPHS